MSEWVTLRTSCRTAGAGARAGTLRETIKELFQPPITVEYPEERLELPGWFRGIPALKTDLSTGAYESVVACGLCEAACPVEVIEITSHLNAQKRKIINKFTIDMSRCMLCNLCVEACPFDALVMANDYELSDYDKENLIFNKEQLLGIGLAYSSETDFAELGKAVKGEPRWIFHEKTGATLADLPEGVKLGEISPFEAKPREKAPSTEEAAKVAAPPAQAAAASAAPPEDGTAPTKTGAPAQPVGGAGEPVGEKARATGEQKEPAQQAQAGGNEQ